MTIVGAYLFGSMARGDHDDSSDVDVLAVYREDSNSNQREKFRRLIKTELGTSVAIAEYSEHRLDEMFQQGHLFTWHLFQEATPLKTAYLRPEAMLVFRRPARYQTSLIDARRFINLLISIRDEIASSPGSLVHEAGLIYLALRNIAMSMSAKHLPNVDFTRHSPFSLSTELGIDAPCAYLDYLRLISARHASQRGTYAPTMDCNELIKLLDQSLTWAEVVTGNTNAK
jgi:predicted nucleotidyltransferase